MNVTPEQRREIADLRRQMEALAETYDTTGIWDHAAEIAITRRLAPLIKQL